MLLCVVLLLGGIGRVAAQAGDALWYRSLGVEQKLSQNLVTAIAQDRDGYLWFGTPSGLDRWDGYVMRSFRHDPGDSNSLGAPGVTALHVDANGRLWVGTSKGVDRFDAATGAFRHHGSAVRTVAGTSEPVMAVTADDAGRAWYVRDSGSRLFRIDGRTGEEVAFAVSRDPGDRVTALLAGTGDRLWVALRSRRAGGIRLVVVDRCSEVGRILPWPREVVSLDASGEAITVLLEDRRRRLWMARHAGGLTRYDPSSGALHLLTGGVGRDALAGDEVRSLALGSGGEIWALAYSAVPETADAPRGLHRVDPDTLAVRQVILRQREVGAASEAQLERLAVDASGVLWMASNAGGLRLADITARGFDLYRREVVGPRGLSSSFVRAVARSRAGDVLVGTPRGLNVIDRATGSVRSWADGAVRLDDPNVQAILEDRRGNQWVGTPRGLVVREASGAVRRYRHRDDDPRSLAADYVKVIHERPDGQVWIGTLGGGLSEFDATTGTFRQVSDGLPSLDVNALYTDARQRLWVGTAAGLATIETSSGPTRRVVRIAADSPPVGRVGILSISESPATPGALWIGTEQRGLCRLALAFGDATCLTAKRGSIPDDTVYGVLADSQGQLWISTNGGLASVDPASGTVRSYADDITLQSSEFNARAFFKAPDGELYFGGVGGLNAFFPNRLLGNALAPRVHVTTVRAFDRAGGPPQTVTDIVGSGEAAGQGEIRLPFARRDVTFEFVALHFIAPERNAYYYRLDGYDDEWLGPVTTRSARYTNLAPGAYTFRVKAVSSHGVPSAKDATFAFVVLTPFYATAWFRALAALLTVVGLVGAYRLRVRGLRRRQVALEQQVSVRTGELRVALDTLGRQAQALKELDEAKSRFFANLSHEFRTPLTLTLGPLRDVRDGRHGTLPSEALAEIDIAIEQTGHQIELVDQLLALARMDAGRVDFRPTCARLDECVRHAAAPFEALARCQGVSLEVDIEGTALYASIDEQKIERVVANLLGNALKFTPTGGAVAIRLTCVGDAWATIDVDDTGPGIPPEDLPHVFERFYRGGQEGGHVPGTGIGLALAREYVDLHGGEIRAENRPEGGTRVTVRLRVLAGGDAAPASEAPGGESSDAGVRPPVVEPTAVNVVDPEDQVDGGLPTVLVVDDHADMRAYVRKHLAPHYRVIEAARADGALELVREQLPDAIVCDVMMPGMDGYAFCRAVKSDPETAFLPVILLTARADVEGRLEGLEEGADDYLTKPFEPAELLARVRNLLRSRERLKARLAEAAQPTSVPAPPVPAPPVLATPRDVPSADEVLLGRLREVFDRAAQDEGFDVGALADALGMSRAQLHRRVKEAFASTPAELIIRYRLERAAEMLKARAGNVAEVAYAVGFKNVSHFVKRFGAQYGHTPAAYAASPSTSTNPPAEAR